MNDELQSSTLPNTSDPELTACDIRGMLDVTDKGNVRQTKRNCMTALENDPILKDAFCFNILTGRMDIVKPLGWQRTGTTMTDSDINHIYLYLEDEYGLTNEKNIQSALKVTADNHQYHPIRNYLNALEWDGTERIRYALHHFLGSDTKDLTYESLKLFMMGAICRAFDPGCKFEVMLCLVGGQGVGKSTFFRFLAINDEWFTDDLKRLEDENVYRKLQGHWIIEMSEMIATASAKNIEEIKGFISRQKETYKVPYEVYPADRLRQCVFGGTSNNTNFLPFDRSGNRRFIPVMVDGEEAEVHILEDEATSRAYVDQMWAEAMQIYRSREFSLKLTPDTEKELGLKRIEFMAEDTEAGIISAYLSNPTISRVCCLMLYREALRHQFDDMNKKTATDIGAIMDAMPGWTRSYAYAFGGSYGTQRSWIREEPPNTNNDQQTMSGFVELDDDEELPF